ncbi:MAG: thioredoxin family protein [Halobacteriovoraceae bacterium]|nr:thioredoxin family protein [Halobacteriovoraceae bacterium]|tara:strand:- start:821 stop:1411 length:591 start_codon:yes stop_codon:yes gene_type:complete
MKSLIALMFLSFSALAVNPGDKAPNFTLKSHSGKEISLEDFKGNYVVLEWYNSGCPYVRKHYDSGNMQTTQKAYQANEKVTWLTIVSSAEGKQGYLADAKAAMEQYNSEKMGSNYLLLDPTGEVGQAYKAKTTPHIFIIDPDLNLSYVGAMDSDSSYKQSAIKGATNYVTSSLSKMMLGEKPDPAKTKPYGCSVKY